MLLVEVSAMEEVNFNTLLSVPVFISPRQKSKKKCSYLDTAILFRARSSSEGLPLVRFPGRSG
eukprot:scaffold296573_cov59-Attheya_sp.AAC.1